MESLELVRLAGNLVDYLRHVCGHSEDEVRAVSEAMNRHLMVAGRQALHEQTSKPTRVACVHCNRLN